MTSMKGDAAAQCFSLTANEAKCNYGMWITAEGVCAVSNESTHEVWVLFREVHYVTPTQRHRSLLGNLITLQMFVLTINFNHFNLVSESESSRRPCCGLKSSPRR